jgi:hypothetical protein
MNEKHLRMFKATSPLIGPVVLKMIEAEFTARKLSYERCGTGFDICYKVGKDSHSTILYIHNLMFEILTVDRDANPLEFDERILKSDYCMHKIAGQVASKLFVLFAWLDGKSAKEIADMVQTEGNYERFRLVEQETPAPIASEASGKT